jgi:hypothetical protein
MEEDVKPEDEDGVDGRGILRVGCVGVWFGCGEHLNGFWVGTWDRDFHSGTSVVFFSFKNAVRGT